MVRIEFKAELNKPSQGTPWQCNREENRSVPSEEQWGHCLGFVQLTKYSNTKYAGFLC